jgi:hypothetical protein
MITTFDTQATGIVTAPALGSSRNFVPFTARLTSWLRLRRSAWWSPSSELPIERLNAHTLRDIGVQADQLPRHRRDQALLAMESGGAFL